MTHKLGDNVRRFLCEHRGRNVFHLLSPTRDLAQRKLHVSAFWLIETDQNNERDLLQLFTRLEFLEHNEAVHLPHLDITNDQIRLTTLTELKAPPLRSVIVTRYSFFHQNRTNDVDKVFLIFNKQNVLRAGISFLNISGIFRL